MKRRGMTKEEFAAQERKMMAEVEAEGVKAEAIAEAKKWGKRVD